LTTPKITSAKIAYRVVKVIEKALVVSCFPACQEALVKKY
jgi:hypothetical protein